LQHIAHKASKTSELAHINTKSMKGIPRLCSSRCRYCKNFRQCKKKSKPRTV